MGNFSELFGKEVNVFANGVVYQGVLVEVSDTEVYIKTPQQWVAIPAGSVGAIELKDDVRVGSGEGTPEELSRGEENTNE